MCNALQFVHSSGICAETGGHGRAVCRHQQLSEVHWRLQYVGGSAAADDGGCSAGQLTEVQV